MHIGIDFDNTIVSYDSLFHKVALEGGLIPADLVPSKLKIRDHLREVGHEDLWTEMQGYVYGARMGEAAPFPGVLEFLRWTRTKGIRVSIISHKTRHPFVGPSYDLHAAAGQWIRDNLADENDSLRQDGVFFETTKEEKLQRIERARCGYFVDDLPEILLAEDFPQTTARILFDPEGHHKQADIATVRSWREIQRYFSDRCETKNP